MTPIDRAVVTVMAVKTAPHVFTLMCKFNQ